MYAQAGGGLPTGICQQPSAQPFHLSLHTGPGRAPCHPPPPPPVAREQFLLRWAFCSGSRPRTQLLPHGHARSGIPWGTEQSGACQSAHLCPARARCARRTDWMRVMAASCPGSPAWTVGLRTQGAGEFWRKATGGREPREALRHPQCGQASPRTLGSQGRAKLGAGGSPPHQSVGSSLSAGSKSQPRDPPAQRRLICMGCYGKRLCPICKLLS